MNKKSFIYKMILILTNFRCYVSRKFELPDEGIVLLHGTSGIGKSSIIKAINFALFGNETKCMRHNATKFSVEFIYKDIKIIRCKPKNKDLHLEYKGEIYKNDVAQEVINKIYDKYFNVTSYIAQKSIDSFYNLSFNQKMEFFNHLSLKDVDINAYKEKNKAIIKQRKDLLKDKSNEIKILKNQLDNFQLPDSIEYPLKSGEYNESEVEKERKAEKLNNDKLNTLIKEQKEIQKKINNVEKIKAENNQIKLEIEFLEKALGEYNLELNNVDNIFLHYDKIEQSITTYIEFIKAKIRLNNEIEELQSYIKDTTENTKNKIKQTRQQLDKNDFDEKNFNNLKFIMENKNIFEMFIVDIKTLDIKLEKDNIQDCIKNLSIDNRKQLEENTLQLNNIQQAILSNEKQLNAYVKNRHIKCPSCKVKLSIVNDEVKCLNDDTLQEDKDILETKLKDLINDKKRLTKVNINLEEILKTLARTENNLPYCIKYIELLCDNSLDCLQQKYKDEKRKIENYEKLNADINRLEYLLNSIKDGSDPHIINRQTNMSKLKSNVSYFKNMKENLSDEYLPEINSCLLEYDTDFDVISKLEDFDDYEDEDILNVLKEVLEIVKKRKNYNESKVNNKNKLVNKINDTDQRLKVIKSKLIDEETEEEENIRKDYSEINNSIEERTNKKEKLDKKLKKLDKYLAYYSEITRYNKLKNDIEFCEKEEKAIISSLAVSENFYKMIVEAETISVSNTLENINMTIKYYMDNFFPEGNMQMELTPFKENKKGDKQTGLDIDIYYNGDKIGLDNLSGGEFDRCLLVLFLSFNNMVSGDLIMLDECLSSVNGELVADIIDILKSSLKGKLVLVTLHQANVGIFDYVLDLEK